MNITKILGAALTLSMLGGAVASAHTVPQPQSQAATMSTLMNAAPTAVLASNFAQPSNLANAPKPMLLAKTLPLANFGQWDEAASEN
ncbi:hypothetical protein ACELLULO517_13135 [Acidisoma cellulosilytica]|uniref:Uncharacterized protein n=1 Tax=Acidisoma cellulosilyticum TaxID=2802395 RepID=A0A963Z1S7_9PROT|nr:hypothetical protein [Acidisoma cellulosilyticum]MCB8881185.1 hypothetical protein [Acidisoma cellulosilyticum]